MKKIIYFLISIILLFSINSCSGYKPIFELKNLQFKISNYEIKGDKKLVNQIYYSLYNFSKSIADSTEVKKIDIIINVLKNKSATSKDSTGKVLEYKINLSAQIIVKDFNTDDEILNEIFNSSSSYKVQDQYSENIKLENKSLENLINETYRNLLIKLADNILKT